MSYIFKLFREHCHITINVILSDSEGSDFYEFPGRSEILRPHNKWVLRMTKKKQNDRKNQDKIERRSLEVSRILVGPEDFFHRVDDLSEGGVFLHRGQD